MSVAFAPPPGSEAAAPAERRDAVRLLVADPERVAHRAFPDLPELLAPGDLVVVNTSATLPAALDAHRADGRPVPVHVAGPGPEGTWLVELRRPDGPDLSGVPGEAVRLPGGVALRLLGSERTARIWRAAPDPPTQLVPYLARHGRPVTYGHVASEPSLADLQNVYATEPGSAEMASAGRPLTERALVRLMARGVAVAPVVLHAGVSSPEVHEPPLPERFSVPPATARLVDATRRGGGRVVAVGTTAVRALESAAASDGTVRSRSAWTDLVLGPERPARVVGGLLTGLHTPQASHLLLLEAVAGERLVQRAYDEAVRERYRWHEFGDSMLLLP